MWRGAASSDWAGGGGWGASGVEPKGEIGVLSLLAGILAGVAAGLVVVLLTTGSTGGESAGGCLGSAGADDAVARFEDHASSVGAAGI
ncbi:hypothetical protein V6N11_058664 [Hibiscus sabdariffa]|uniref:Uncharacterized protein n=1 Tax=Hibiscus sabdariffa TaxID=183260 RepID=A0ABR2U4X2_9ROSI